jgi:hypothetical protein
METKICKECKKEKLLDDFGISKNNSDGHNIRCKECINRLSRDSYLRNIEKQKIRSKIKYEKNKIILKEKHKIYYQNNKESINKSNKNYRDNNKEKLNNYFRKYDVNKRSTDNVYKIKSNIKRSIRQCITENGYTKKSRTYEILGCSYEDFIIYLDSKFDSWMNWNNYGLYNGTPNYGWDIDHVIPLASATTEEELIKLNHFTNLQPLCSYINRYVKRHNINWVK